MIVKLLVLFIRLYRLTLSPWLGPTCRFEPSCSQYAMACLTTHGALKGSWLALLRLSKCHPFHPGGYDPPPPLAPPSGNSSSGDRSERAA